MSSELTWQERAALSPEPLQTIIEEFREVEPRERLEYLLEYSDENIRTNCPTCQNGLSHF